MQSTKFSLQARDWLKGALVAFGTAFLTSVTQWINAGALPTWPQTKVSLIAGIAALVVYLTKNFMTDDVKQSEKVLTEAAAKEGKVLDPVQFEKPAAPNDKSIQP